MIPISQPTGSCVLMLHRVVDGAELDHDLSRAGFHRILSLIEEHDLTVTATLDPPSLGKPAVTLTFDDGTIDHLAVGRELASRGMPGVFFVPVSAIGQEGHLAVEDVRELAALGHVVGGHGFSNKSFTGLSEAEVAREVGGSAAGLREILDGPARFFAPPGGSSNPLLVTALRDHGFTASRSTRWGIYRSPGERWDVPCVPVADATMKLGWVEHSIRSSQIPWTMRGLYTVKSVIPLGVRNPVRRSLRRGVTAIRPR